MQKEETGVRGGLEAKSYGEVGGTLGPPQISELNEKQDAIHLYSIWHPLPPSNHSQTAARRYLRGRLMFQCGWRESGLN